MNKSLIVIPVLFLSFNVLSQVRFNLNDSILMVNMKICYYGDSIVYNDLKDEFRIPLPKCSEVTFYSFEVGGDLYVTYPRHSEYCGSGGCHIHLMKKINGKYEEIDHIWGNLDVEKSKVSPNTFYYRKTDKSSWPYKTVEQQFIVDIDNEKFKLIKNAY